jgi:DNA-binding transcriptional ArsR family regulator
MMDITFKAINDPTRRDILVFLTQGPQNAGEIAKQFAMTKPSISHHLDLLKQGELISADKKGQFIIYSLNRSGFELIHTWFQGFSQYFEFPKPKIRLTL